ncbi:SUMF1/EgtB/PvdO family nonheme iron enzyme [Actinomadura barringtoniae]|uniref:SUMF1/EgtB/PvdO family nonheme iron enzyme n=1 Tax=Actinomadura barringtoniae TaxID=1427535 RepID=A0A939PA20_9ACTN|nr:SUMF1/EgtB/PvdO family nonheme iron enzyme [Actinomadura barringtoniae]
MVALAPGEIVLRDEGSSREWAVKVDAFSIATVPVNENQLPLTEVSWLDAILYCNDLSKTEGLRPSYSGGEDPDGLDVVCDWDADGYRLPTEAEWEYACRAGTTGTRYGDLPDIAWYRANSDDHVHEVGGKAPNAWGLYDTIGNVWEWCWDLYDPKVYGPYRVFRSGGAYDRQWGCHASSRRKSHPTLRIDDLGFRVARST